MNSRIHLSVVLPAFNEGHIIEQTLDRVDNTVKQIGLSYEIIVVNDGSEDDTKRKAVNYAHRNGHVKVVSYNRNVGKGHAVKTGFQNAAGDVVIFIDSDLDIDPQQIIHYSKALGTSDIAMGSKWHPQSRVKIPLIRRILSHAFHLLARFLTGVNASDAQTGLKILRKNALTCAIFSRLMVKRYAYDTELLALANFYGLKVAELPVQIQIESAFNVKEVLKMLIDLLGIWYRFRISKYYQCCLRVHADG